MKTQTVTAEAPAVAKASEVRTSVNSGRIASIDIVRALTMILMIFVNDLWSLQSIPAWLGHVERGVDGIGLADVVFPGFLFIVGLSLPFSVDNRRLKGESDREIMMHVLIRSVALLVMGVFLVNGETINTDATGMARHAWNSICCLCFIVIWNSYPEKFSKAVVYTLRGAAVVTLVWLAIIYRGGSDEEIKRFAPQWWGILGLIGWAYLASGVLTVLARNSFRIVLTAWIFFAALSMLYHAGLVPDFLSFIPSAILGGTLTGLTVGGVLTALIFKHYLAKRDNRSLTIVLVAFSAVLIILSVVTRPYWGLAKLGATPAWLFLCSAFTVLAFLAVYWIADVAGKERWFNIIRPAGAATLLCYLIPYFSYATMRFLGIGLPDFMLIGGVGLLKSFLFALLCAWITGLLVKAGLRFKV